MLILLAIACAPKSTEDSAATEVTPSCDASIPKLTLGYFPEGSADPWRPYGDNEHLCFRTGPSGNGSTWPEIRVTGRTQHGHITARLVRDGELLYEVEYDEAMSRPSDNLCAYTSHFYLWLPFQIIESFDGRDAVLAAIFEDNDDSGAGMLQDSVSMIPVVCNPEEEL